MNSQAPAFGSFEELAMPLFGQLYNHACWLCGDQTAAEDLVQETFMKALRGFSGFEQGTNFRAWIFRILRNTFLTTQAGLRTHVPLDGDEDGADEPGDTETPESLLLAQAETETIRAALESLRPHYREVILLCDVEEMSYAEIAIVLGIPMGTVMSRISRGRRAMRQELAAKMEGAAR